MARIHRLTAKKLKTYQKRLKRVQAKMGEGDGTTPVVSGHPYLVRVRQIGSSLPYIVHNIRGAPNIDGWPVVVGESDAQRRVLQVLETNINVSRTLPGGSGPAAHAPSHYMDGTDPVYIHTKQITPLAIYPLSGMTVAINPGWLATPVGGVAVLYQTLDLTGDIPVNACFVALQVHNTTGVLTSKAGTDKSLADLAWSDAPAPDGDNRVLYYAKLYAGMTAISNSVHSPDLFDVRFAGGGGGALIDHDHSGDAGDGGQLDWDNIWSDAVHSHASDAEGGQLDWDTAWADAVHTHASNAEGGTLDWDTVWADAVHDHSSNAEGGTLALDNLSDVDTTGKTSGDIIYNNAGTWEDYPLGIGTKVSVTSNKIRFGNASGGNYLEIDLTTGNLRLVGDATAWDDLRLSGSSARVGVTAPSVDAFGPSGSLRTLRFEEAHHDEIYFEIQMPHAWKEGTNIHPHVHWSPVTTEAGNVVWQLDYTWANIDDTFGAPTTMTTDATAAGGTAWVHKLSKFKDGSANEYIVGTGKTISSMLVCRLHRDAGAGDDTLTEDVAFLEFDLHYEIDSFGSDEEYVKDASEALLLETGDYLLLESGDNLLLG